MGFLNRLSSLVPDFRAPAVEGVRTRRPRPSTEERVPVRSLGAVAGRQWFLPYADATSTNDSPEIRAAMRQMLRDPYVKSGWLSQVLTVVSQDFQVHKPRAAGKDPLAQEQADFVRDALEASSGEMVGLATSVLMNLGSDGFSLCEKVLYPIEHGPHRGKIGLTDLKPKDPERDVRLFRDAHNNVTGATAIRTNETFPITDFTYVRYLHTFDEPAGMAAFRASYGSYWMRDTVRKLRAIHHEKKAAGTLKGTYEDPADKSTLEAALRAAKSATWITVPKSVQVEAMSLSTASEADWKSFDESLREEILVGVALAHLHILQGGVSDARGDTKVHKAVADLGPWLLTYIVQVVLNRQVIRDLVDYNYAQPAGGYPRVTLGGVTTEEALQTLQLLEGAQKAGFKPSRNYYASALTIQEADPDDPEDQLAKPGDGPPAGPAAGGLQPFADEPKPPPIAPAPQPMGGAAFPKEHAARFADFFAPSQHGHFPGGMHAEFGLDVPGFAAATGLLRKAVRRGGALDWVWARKPAAPPPITAPAATPFAEPGRVSLPAADDFDPASAGLHVASFADGGVAYFAADRKTPANGRYKDALGRARCYQDGKQIPCKDHPDETHPVARHVPSAREVMNKKGPITHDDVKAMTHHLERMTVPELKEFQREFMQSAAGRQVKAQRVKSLLDWAKNERGNLDMGLEEMDAGKTGTASTRRADNLDPLKKRTDKALPETPITRQPDVPISEGDLDAAFGDHAHSMPPDKRIDAVSRLLSERASWASRPYRSHGMANEEQMKEATVAGVKVRWSTEHPAALRGAARTIESVFRPGSGQGSKLLTDTSSLTFTTQRCSHDPRWEKEYDMPGFKSSATGGDGHTVVYNQNSEAGGGVTQMTISHENGHNIAHRLWGTTTPAAGSEYAKAQQSEPPVSSYGAKSPSEDFAEAVAIYQFNPKAMAERFPLKAAAIRKILEPNGPQ